MGYKVNKTPKAKLRIQLSQWLQSHDTVDEDDSNMEGYQDPQMTSEEEQIGDCISRKLEDVLEELTAPKHTPIWAKLEFIDQWEDCVANLVINPTGSNVYKQ